MLGSILSPPYSHGVGQKGRRYPHASTSVSDIRVQEPAGNIRQVAWFRVSEVVGLLTPMSERALLSVPLLSCTTFR